MYIQYMYDGSSFRCAFTFGGRASGGGIGARNAILSLIYTEECFERFLILKPAHYRTPGQAKGRSNDDGFVGLKNVVRLQGTKPYIHAGSEGGFSRCGHRQERVEWNKPAVGWVVHEFPELRSGILWQDVDYSLGFFQFDHELGGGKRGPGAGAEHSLPRGGVAFAVACLGRIDRAEDGDSMITAEPGRFLEEHSHITMVDNLVGAECGEAVHEYEPATVNALLGYGYKFRDGVFGLAGGVVESVAALVEDRHPGDRCGVDSHPLHSVFKREHWPVAGHEHEWHLADGVGEYVASGLPVREDLEEQGGFARAGWAGDKTGFIGAENFVD
jgi:hypothetical protein